MGFVVVHNAYEYVELSVINKNVGFLVLKFVNLYATLIESVS